MYGEPLYAYTRLQKMQAAAELLRRGDDTIMEIAGRFGYDNASKFAAAFRTVMGTTPHQYRSAHFEEAWKGASDDDKADS